MTRFFYHTISIIACFIIVNATVAQSRPFKPLTTPFVEPDSSLKSMKAISQTWTIHINEFMASNDDVIFDEAMEAEDWIEIHNYGDEAVDLNGMYISDDLVEPLKYQLTATGSELILAPDAYLILWADDDETDGSIHLNFKLSASGESIVISTTDQVLIDQYTFGAQTVNISEGKVPGSADWIFYNIPTPNAENGVSGLIDKLPKPILSVSGGLYTATQTLDINYPDNQASLYFTTDGSIPTKNSTQWSNGQQVSTTSMVRVKAFRDNYLSSEVASHTYIFENGYELDIISIQANDDDLFGSAGIYTNESSGLEKEIHLEYFKNTGELAFEVNAGVKIHAPKGHPQKALRLYTRSEYGDKEINYKIFDDKDIDIFKRLVLRNGSNDSQPSGGTHFKDGLYHEIFGSVNKRNHNSAYRPVNVYLNGEYWGIYNLRERQDRYYAKPNVGTEKVDLLEWSFYESPSYLRAIEGDFNEFSSIETFVKTNDMSIDANYAVIEENVNIKNFVDYHLFEIFSGNRDWYNNNVKWVKPRGPGEKWEWILWDIEYGLGTYRNSDHGKPEWSAVAYAYFRGGWPWSANGEYTYFLRNLLDNKKFRDYFANRYADLMNTTLREENFVAKIQETKDMLANDMAKHIEVWGLSMSTWNNSINYLTYYANNRPTYARKNLKKYILNKFSDSTYVDSTFTIYVDVMPQGAGKIKINTITPDTYPFDGIYFNSVPIEVTVIPNPGYQFSHWSDQTHTQDWFTHLMSEDYTVTAFFEDEVTANMNDIVINEISYNQHSSWETGDWIELKNSSSSPVNLDNWSVTDENNHSITNLGNVTIPANGFLVISPDITNFQSYHPTVSNIINKLGFGLDSKDGVRLYDNNGELVDAVYYDNDLPWPTLANGSGATLELDRNETLNTDPTNWFAFPNAYGTPGEINHFRSEIDERQNKPIQISPNPFTDNIILAHNGKEGSWELANLQGQILSSGVISNSEDKSIISLQSLNLSQGTYLFKFKTSTETVIRPITKLNR
jgi:hypothetical protein